jgi:hypothetical protein
VLRDRPRSVLIEACLHRLSTYSTGATFESIQGVPQSAILVTTICETAIDSEMKRLVSQSGVSQIQLGRALLDHAGSNIDGSWPRRLHWLKAAFDVEIGSSPEYQDFRVLVEFRNSIAHGDGMLTRRQSSKAADVLQLEGDLRRVLDVSTEGGRIFWSSETTHRAVRVARSFLVHLDTKLH